MIENYDFSDFLGIFFVVMPAFIFVLSGVFEGLISLFAPLNRRRIKPQIVLHYHYRDKR